MTWYYSDGVKQFGPVPEAELLELRRSGVVTADTLIWREGMANWTRYQEAGPAVNLEGVPPIENAPPLIPVPPGLRSDRPEAVCAECGKIFPKDEMIGHGAGYVCATCKPIFVQKLSEGARMGSAGSPWRFRYAGFWIRFAAKFVDGIILSVVLYVPILILIFARGGNIEDMAGRRNSFDTQDVLMLIWQLLYYVFYASYEIFFIGKYGATPGKMACQIRVVTAEGERVGYGRATGRFFANLLSMIICYIGYIMVGFDDQKRALHDHICSTRVVYKD